MDVWGKAAEEHDGGKEEASEVEEVVEGIEVTASTFPVNQEISKVSLVAYRAVEGYRTPATVC